MHTSYLSDVTNDDDAMDTSLLHRPHPIRVYLVEDSAVIRKRIFEDFAGIPGIKLAGYAETESDAFNQLIQESFDCTVL